MYFLRNLALIFIFWSVGLGCSKPMNVELSSESSARCQPGAGASGSPKNIEEAVALINSLPKPVTVDCFLESLDRPLKVSLTNSEASAQPAAGTRSPRVFIFIDQLLISVVPAGLGSKMVEFSLLTAADKSIKGELPFPVQQELELKAPYEHIRYGSGTICASCHGVEQQAPQITFTQAFISKAVQPSWTSRVGLTDFRKEYTYCDFKKEPERCKIIRSIFGFGEVKNQDFPAAMPVAF